MNFYHDLLRNKAAGGAGQFADLALSYGPLLYFRFKENDWTPDAGETDSINSLVAISDKYGLCDQDTSTKRPTQNQTGLLTNDSLSLSFSFDGSNDALHSSGGPVDPIGQFFSTTALTICCLINGTNFSGDRCAVGAYDTAITTGNHTFWLGRTTGGKAQYLLRLDNDSTPGAVGATTLNTGTTYFMAGVFNATTGIADIYVDGINDGTVSFGLGRTLKPTVDHFFVGNGVFNTSQVNFFAGRISEVMFFNSALTATQILALQNSR